MSDWTEIVKLISVKQRIFALFLILMFPVLSFLGGKFLDNNDCRSLIEENKLLHGDLIEISQLIRKQRMRDVIASNDEYMMKTSTPNINEIYIDSTIMFEVKGPTTIVKDNFNNSDIIDEILKITKKY